MVYLMKADTFLLKKNSTHIININNTKVAICICEDTWQKKYL